MDTGLYVLGGMVVLGVVSNVAVQGAAYLENRHNTRLARMAGYAGRAAGWMRDQIQDALRTNPTMDPDKMKRDLLTKFVDYGMREFADSAKVVGGTPAKLGDMIIGEYGKLAPVNSSTDTSGIAPLVAAAVAPAVTSAVASLLDDKQS